MPPDVVVLLRMEEQRRSCAIVGPQISRLLITLTGWWSKTECRGVISLKRFAPMNPEL